MREIMLRWIRIQYTFHTIGPKVTQYHRCGHRKICQGKVVIKGDVIQVKEHHSWEVKVKATNVVVDTTKRIADQVRTIATAQPTKPYNPNFSWGYGSCSGRISR